MDFPLVAQAASGVDTSTPQHMTSSQITTFADQNPAYTTTVDSQPDATFSTSDTADDDLASFFSRPIKIHVAAWAVNDALFDQFDPWWDFFSNPRVLNRISNYHLLRAKLHVKFVINGNAFYSGRLLASYQPLASFDTLTSDVAFFPQYLIPASQRPHLFLNPTTSMGGDMELPFFWMHNYLSIPNSEWKNMGDLTIRSINPLKHASGGVTPVLISVFAWATDVVLSVPTSVNPDSLVPQSDEYGTGPISRPASILARAAGALTTAPVIGPYARATQMGASAVSTAATAFGYSRPPILSDTQPVRLSYGNLVNTNVPDSVTKLSVDVKQELTVDPRTVGLSSTDEMTILSIAQRQSYLTTIPWNSDASIESRLFSTIVDPYLFDTISNAGESGRLFMTASAFAAKPFKYWRGSMIFRFQIVANGFQRGRLKVVYDPCGNASATAEYNTAHTFVVDIAEQQDFSVTVGWGATTSYRERYASFQSYPNPALPTVPFRIGSSMVPYNPSTPTGNGTLAVYVVNQLTTNNVGFSDVAINVYASAGPDFEVANFIGVDGTILYNPPVPGALLVPQAAELVVGTNDETQDMPNMAGDNMTLIPGVSPTDHTNDVFFGEAITSFRQVLKRYTLHKISVTPTGPGQFARYTYHSNAFPGYRTHTDGTFRKIANVTMVQYVASAFVGWRGGLRWKIYHSAGQSSTPTGFASVTRLLNSDATEPTVTTENYSDVTLLSTALMEDILPGSTGVTVTAVGQHPSIEVEIPFQTNARFAVCKNRYLPTLFNDSSYRYDYWASGQGNNWPIRLDTYLSTGEDFSCFFFTGAPTQYYFF